MSYELKSVSGIQTIIYDSIVTPGEIQTALQNLVSGGTVDSVNTAPASTGTSLVCPMPPSSANHIFLKSVKGNGLVVTESGAPDWADITFTNTYTSLDALTDSTDNNGRGILSLGNKLTGGQVAAGLRNTIVGTTPKSSLTAAVDNTILGNNAATNLSTGQHNIVIGSGAVPLLNTAANNVYIGDGCAVSHTTNVFNTCVGVNAMSGVGNINTTVGIGYNACVGSNLNNGTIIGNGAGGQGTNCTVVGVDSQAEADNASAFGSNCIAKAEGQTVLGHATEGEVGALSTLYLDRQLPTTASEASSKLLLCKESPGGLVGRKTYALSDGLNGQCLFTSGSGLLSWDYPYFSYVYMKCYDELQWNVATTSDVNFQIDSVGVNYKTFGSALTVFSSAIASLNFIRVNNPGFYEFYFNCSLVTTFPNPINLQFNISVDNVIVSTGYLGDTDPAATLNNMMSCVYYGYITANQVVKFYWRNNSSGGASSNGEIKNIFIRGRYIG